MRRLATLMTAAAFAVSGVTASAAHTGEPGHQTMAGQGAAAASPGEAAEAGGVKVVRYGGYVISVPAGWPVYRLDRDPSRCVRFDHHAVYLGPPGGSQHCPAHLAGRVATVSLQLPGSGGVGPAGPSGGPWRAAGSGQAPESGQAAAISLSPAQRRAGATLSADPADDQVRAVFAGSGLTVTVTYGGDAGLAGRILRTVRRVGPLATAATGPGQHAAPAGAAAAGPGEPAASAGAGAGLVARPDPAGTRLAAAVRPSRPHHKHHHGRHRHGKHHRRSRRHGRNHHGGHHHGRHRHHHHHRPMRGFDTCAAPSLRVMHKWRHAFAAAAIYLGGPEAACGWGNLSRRWVRSATRMGWSLIPTYVGPQAPCTRFGVRIRPGHAEPQGRAAARYAISLARALGLHRGAPIYYDMEAYNSRHGRCRHPVLAFLDGWTRQLHRHGYRAGVYSSAGSAARDIGRAWQVYGHRIAKPNTVWFGLWDNRANLNGAPYLHGSWWGGAHRIKQYRGGHRRRIRGARLDIDSDIVYGAVYR